MNSLLLMSEGSAVTVDSMWGTITTGASEFVDGVLTPVFNVCSTNGICLAFLSVTFVGLGVKLIRKVISAFGRGKG